LFGWQVDWKGKTSEMEEGGRRDAETGNLSTFYVQGSAVLGHLLPDRSIKDEEGERRQQRLKEET
jgi:hypothetical protein